jgi:hypothetical protein
VDRAPVTRGRSRCETRRTAEVSGTCDSRFAPLRDALAEQLAGGNELGASIAVDGDGETLVDIWGWRDEARRAYHAHNQGHLVGELCLACRCASASADHRLGSLGGLRSRGLRVPARVAP